MAIKRGELKELKATVGNTVKAFPDVDEGVIRRTIEDELRSLGNTIDSTSDLVTTLTTKLSPVLVSTLVDTATSPTTCAVPKSDLSIKLGNLQDSLSSVNSRILQLIEALDL
jgi:hypothetical protein